MDRKIGVVFSYILMGVEILTSFLFTPYLIRCLGQSQYGVYTLVNSISSYLVLLDLGIGNSIVRYVAKFRVTKQQEYQNKFVGVTLIFYFSIAIITIIVGCTLKNVLPDIFGKGLTGRELELASEMLTITMFNMAVTFIFTVFDKIILAYEYYATAKSIAIVKVLLRVTLMTLFLHWGFGAIAVVKINLLVTSITGIASMTYVLKKIGIHPQFKKVEFTFIKEILSYSLFIFLQMIATQINAMADHILLGIFASSTILAVYGIGSQILQYYQQIANSVNGVLMPGVVRLVEKGASAKEIQNEMVRIGRILFILLAGIFVTFVFAGQDFVTLWAGAENRNAYYVIILIMFPMVFYLTEAIGTQILWAKDKHKFQAVIKFCVTILNVGLSIILIRWNALLGATIGTMMAYLLGDVVVMNIVFAKDIGISIKEYYQGLFKGITKALLICIVFGILSRQLFSTVNWLVVFEKCILLVSIYGISLWKWGMNNSEKDMIKSILKKVRKK